MVSINLSDFFHDMLITQASRPVTYSDDQLFPSLPAAPLKGLGQTKRQPDAPQEKATPGSMGVFSAQYKSVNRSIER